MVTVSADGNKTLFPCIWCYDDMVMWRQFAKRKEWCQPNAVRQVGEGCGGLGRSVALALLLACMAAPLAADEWLHIEVPATGQEMWVDVEARRYWLPGRCDGGRDFERWVVDGDRLLLEIAETLQAELTPLPLAVEQRLVVHIQGDRGSLQVASPGLGDSLLTPLRVERSRRRSAPGCSP